jgi:CubicO group peptidase (beta-lactamase class C family)
MKKIIALTAWVLLSTGLYAQPSTEIEKKVDEKAQLIKRYFNAKQIDSLYGLMAPSFTKMVSKEALEQGLVTQLAPMGLIGDFDFISHKNGVSKYKTKMMAGITLQTMVGIDEDGMVSTFAMQPYKDDATPKRTTLYSDNALKTALDSVVDKAARDYMMDSITAGLSVAVHWQGKDYYYNYGEADKQSGKKANLETVYEIGSITKTMVGFLLAKAAVEKKLDLNVPFTQYLPDSVAKNEALGKITLTHLANHTSGLPRLPVDLFSTPGLKQEDPYAHYTDDMMMKGLSQIKPTRAPGEQYEYSNYAFGILGTILGRVYQNNFEKLAMQSVFQPMKMANTTAGNDFSPQIATGYNEKGVKTSYWKFQSMAAIGSIKSNAKDMLQYGKETLELMNSGNPMAPLLMAPTFDKPPTVVSLGWHLENSPGQAKVYMHGGGTYGFRSQIMICPEENWVVVTLANHGIDPGASAVAARIVPFLRSATK